MTLRSFANVFIAVLTVCQKSSSRFHDQNLRKYSPNWLLSGWVREQDSQHRSLYGAQLHQVTDKGHWIEVMASLSKKGADVHNFARGEELARKAGFVREHKTG